MGNENGNSRESTQQRPGAFVNMPAELRKRLTTSIVPPGGRMYAEDLFQEYDDRLEALAAWENVQTYEPIDLALIQRSKRGRPRKPPFP